jgi:hypothetical protein
MTAQESEVFLRQVEDLGRRAHARLHQFREHGEFADTHKEFLKELERQQKEIEARIDVEIKKGMSWELIKLEFRRDFSGMVAEFLRWEERLDAASMKTA